MALQLRVGRSCAATAAQEVAGGISRSSTRNTALVASQLSLGVELNRLVFLTGAAFKSNGQLDTETACVWVMGNLLIGKLDVLLAMKIVR